MLASKAETHDFSVIGGELKSFRAATVENACQEAKALGRLFFDAFLRIKRLAQDQPTYKAQVDLFSLFTAEGLGLLPDTVTKGLENLIEWKRED